MTYRLLSYRNAAGAARAGILVGDAVYDLEAEFKALRARAGFDTVSLIAAFRQWERARKYFDRIAGEPRTTPMPLAGVTLAAPLQYPGVLYMAGANYVDHLKEMTGGEPPDKSKCQPFFFLKTVEGTVVGPGDEIHLPSFSKQVDWEAEIAFVIGRPARNVSVRQAMRYVAGYTILNDVSARDLSRRDDVPFIFDWIGQKCFDTAAPMGPWITPADQIGDPDNLAIKLWVNETLHQNSNTSQLFFNYAEQIAYLSKHVTLNPGDVVSTGTPAGVGHGKGEYLKGGDVVRIEIENIGELRNPVVQD